MDKKAFLEFIKAIPVKKPDHSDPESCVICCTRDDARAKGFLSRALATGSKICHCTGCNVEVLVSKENLPSLTKFCERCAMISLAETLASGEHPEILRGPETNRLIDEQEN